MSGDLFEPYNGFPPYVTGSDTSLAAAESINVPAHTLRGKVFAAIKTSHRGMTCDELEVALSLRHQTASARVRELYLKGLIKDTSERRATRSGRQAAVWRVAE